jgi:hypothetical protein
VCETGPRMHACPTFLRRWSRVDRRGWWIIAHSNNSRRFPAYGGVWGAVVGCATIFFETKNPILGGRHDEMGRARRQNCELCGPDPLLFGFFMAEIGRPTYGFFILCCQSQPMGGGGRNDIGPSTSIFVAEIFFRSKTKNLWSSTPCGWLYSVQ